ncbi:Hypothetical predicted protein [Paramuricea clavata]|uniref:Uncharacterized protein n=1 Tax=Paramuricea clavata TaxID=317549 RepID=A0A6S7I391_PARCT|nr:Hypothetical predicted protein [Paramuricea clavata]
MPLVKEALFKIVELSKKTVHLEIRDLQWKEVEDEILEECDAAYKVGKASRCCEKRNRGEQMCPRNIRVVRVTGRILAEVHPRITGKESYPPYMLESVRWLLTLPECNWTEAHRRNWV